MGMETFELDMTSTSIVNFCNGITHIDLLINNYGITMASALADLPVSAFKKQFGVNVFGTLKLTLSPCPSHQITHPRALNALLSQTP